MLEKSHTKSATEPSISAKHPARSGRFRFSAALFLIALIFLFIAFPFLELFGDKTGDSIEALLMTLVLVSGVLAVGGRHRTLVLAVVLVAPALVARWFNLFLGDTVPVEFYLVPALVFIGFVMLQLIFFILRAPRVNSEVLCAGVAGYLLLGIIWMFAYILVARLQPIDPNDPQKIAAFSYNVGPPATHFVHSFDAFYFSFITLSTVGYGDITPMSHVARTLAMAEAMTGTLYIAVLISRLVALYTSQGSEMSEKKD
jgi:voltage-gated potassium channel